MPTAQPNTGNDDRDREAAALALLLLGTRKRYDLLALVKQNRIRPRPFRQIRPTLALKADLAAPHFTIANGWAGETDALMRAYDSGGLTGAQQQLAITTARLAFIVAAARTRFMPTIARIEQWHRIQWLSRVRASTGLDVSLVTQPQDVVSDMQATVAWNEALADDLHQQTRGRIAQALVGAAAVGLSSGDVRDRINEAVAKARKRAGNIGDDQVERFSRSMDRSRREAAGITSFRWRHSLAVKHPRRWHLARNNRVFTADDIAADDRAGVPFGCQCWEEPLFA